MDTRLSVLRACLICRYCSDRGGHEDARADSDHVEELEGRRLYVHEFSLRSLASQDVNRARDLFRALAAVRVAEIIHHHLVDQGGDLEIVRVGIALEILRPFEEVWKADLGVALADVGFRPSVPCDRSRFLPLLVNGERIIATCSEDGYYTFATGVKAANRMLADHEPMAELTARIRRGTGPEDLTIINGKEITVVRQNLGTGIIGHGYHSYFSFLRRQLDI